VTREV